MSNIRLSKSGIEYLDYSWGVFSGCHNLERGICPVKACWAKSITERFAAHYPNGFKPTFYIEALESPVHIKKPARIGVAWVGDVIGYGLDYKSAIYKAINKCPQHTFLFLTKNPEELIGWSPFPENCWVGVTATDMKGYLMALNGFRWVKATVKFLSCEPLLDRFYYADSGAGIFSESLTEQGIQWIILGAQTKPTVLPKLEWVKEIVEAADKAGIPVFLKNNLRKLLPEEPPYYLPVCAPVEGHDPCINCDVFESCHTDERWHKLRQEMPE